MYIADNEDLSQATKLWRWNLNGLGYSQNGVNGQYGLAMTMDGEIVADYITTGVLRSIQIINGNNFSVDANGNMTASNANIEGEINATSGKIDEFFIRNGGLYAINSDDIESEHNADGFKMWYTATVAGATMKYELINIECDDSLLTTVIKNSGITTPSITQTSKEDDKKNFENLEGALEEVLKTDIYKYHLKNQKDTDKKHIGFVIGDKFNYSNLITAVDKDGKEIGVDTYAMISVLWKALQEEVEKRDKQIQELKKEIKEDKNNG